MHVNLVFLIFEPRHSEAVMPAGRPGEGRNRSRLSNGDVQASMYDNEEDRFKDVSIDVKVLLTQYCCVILFNFNIPFLDFFTNIFPFNFHGYWYFFVILKFFRKLWGRTITHTIISKENEQVSFSSLMTQSTDSVSSLFSSLKNIYFQLNTPLVIF